MSRNLQIRSLLTKHCKDQDEFLKSLEPCLSSKNFKLTKPMLIRLVKGESLSADREEAIIDCIECIFETKRVKVTKWRKICDKVQSNFRLIFIIFIFIFAIILFSLSLIYDFEDKINTVLNGAGSIASILGFLLVFLKK